MLNKILKFILSLFKSAPKVETPKAEAPKVEVKPPEVKDKNDIALYCPWMKVAEKELGQKEIVGSKDNPRIVEYHKYTSLKATDDETPWCASFVCFVLEKSGIKSTKSARAKSFSESKDFVKVDIPVYGCIVVYTRDQGGHVHFYVKQNTSSIFGLGGNQSNEVNISAYKKANLIGFYWPEAKMKDYYEAVKAKNA